MNSHLLHDPFWAVWNRNEAKFKHDLKKKKNWYLIEYPGCTRLMVLIIHISHVEDHAETLFVSPFLTYDYEQSAFSMF